MTIAVIAEKKEVSPSQGLKAMLERARPHIEDVMAKGYDPARLLRMAVLACNKNPKIYECSPASVLAAVIQCARLGLDPGSPLGGCAIVPFKKQAVFILQYKGMLQLAHRSPKVQHVQAHIVREHDSFSLERSSEGDKFVHLLNDRVGSDKPIGVYAVVYYTHGKCNIEYMTALEVEAIRLTAPGGEEGPWINNPDEMWRKTALRRLSKWLPLDPDAKAAVDGDGKPRELTDEGEIVDVEPVETATDRLRESLA